MATKSIALRLEDDVWQQVTSYQRESGIDSPSQAIRSLIELAMRDSIPVDVAFRRAAWREGVRQGAKRIRDEMEGAVDRAMKVLGA